MRVFNFCLIHNFSSGSGSFNAIAGLGPSQQSFPGYLGNTGTYASKFGYGKNDYNNYVIPNYGSGGGGGGGQNSFSNPSYNSGFSNPPGFGGGYGGGFGGYGSGFGGYGGGGAGCFGCGGSGFSGYREGGPNTGFGGSSSGAGAGSFAGSGGFPSNFGYGGFGSPSFMPFDFASLMQQHLANAAAHEEFIRYIFKIVFFNIHYYL